MTIPWNIYVGITIVIPTNFWAHYVKVRKSLNNMIIIWDNTILEHIDTRVSLLKHEGVCVVYRPNGTYKKNKYRQISIHFIIYDV
jgi:hypothetical protein